jgi:hypothetical protein
VSFAVGTCFIHVFLFNACLFSPFAIQPPRFAIVGLEERGANKKHTADPLMHANVRAERPFLSRWRLKWVLLQCRETVAVG